MLFQRIPIKQALLTRSKYTVPDLPYDYNALEPHISAEIMKLHHDKHHTTYVNNLNIAHDKLNVSSQDITQTIALQSAIRFNGGGHLNHSIFWTNLVPAKNYVPPSGEVEKLIIENWQSFDGFKKVFTSNALTVQGSGWCWLGFNKVTQRLTIVTCPNQDPLEATTGIVPLLGCDVWEHAYYLQYKNVRGDYLDAFWKVVNWKNVGERLDKVQKKK